MGDYLKLFETHSEYQTYISGQDALLPNVSYCEDNNEVHYNPLVNETKLVVYYDIQDISSPTTIFTNYGSNVKSIEVDGTLLDSVVTTYQFDNVGEHVIKYEFNNSTVGNSTPLFNNLTTIKRVVIADTFTSIDNVAFLNCSGLTSVTIGNNVTSININAFANCTSLTSVTLLATTPPTLGVNVFDNTNNCPIYVPSASVDTYKAASGWSDYASRIQAIPTS